MDPIETVIAYFKALDSADMQQADQYLAEDYQLIDFAQKPMTKDAMLGFLRQMKVALPNLLHSLYNIRLENDVVKVTVQLSGMNSENLDLREMGIGVVRKTQKFIIFPNGNYEFTVKVGKISTERDVSAASPNRRMSGMLKALGVNVAAL